MNVTQEEVRKYFTYKDGRLFNKIRRAKAKEGLEAGSVTNKKNGYRYVCFKRKMYLLHRFIYFYHHGVFPEFIDHIDQDKNNNRIENLRAVTKSQNHCNKGKQSNNTTGVKGTCLNKKTGKYQAQIGFQKKIIYLGSYDTLAEAAEARMEAEKKYHGDYADSLTHGLQQITPT